MTEPGPTPTGTARTLLFVPGSRPDRFDKAAAAGADLVVVDLEDAVADADKAQARSAALAWRGAPGSIVRVNAVGTPEHAADVAAVAGAAADGAGPLAVMLPKSDAGSVHDAANRLGAAVPIVALVETARGIRDVDTVAQHPSVVRLAFGSIDYALDLALRVGEAELELLFARSHLVNASRAAGIAAPVDGVTTDLDDPAAARRDSERAHALGFGGKLCLHPRQLAAVDAAFRPGADEVAWARRVVAAADRAPDGAFRLDGRMVDAPVLAQARRIVAAADGPPQ
ncbi:HpcH/HpaI aldolase/citrate lyase family protein [Jatrophihabitans fulvus]